MAEFWFWTLPVHKLDQNKTINGPILKPILRENIQNFKKVEQQRARKCSVQSIPKKNFEQAEQEK